MHGQQNVKKYTRDVETYSFSHISQFKESEDNEINMVLLLLDATYVSGMNIMTVCSQHT